jgi:hypothetical protein
MHRIRRLGRGPMLAIAAAAIIAVGVAGWLLFGQGLPPEAQPSATEMVSPSPSTSPSASPSPSLAVPVACPLNGLPIEDPSLLEKVAIAVQVENNPFARPQRNLSSADFVVEAPVEGDTTRFSAIFLCRPTVGLTGPIRSSRYYEIDLWQDLGVLPVGFGGSTAALRRFAAAGMPYVNGITGSWPWFHRHGTHRAPHNLYGDMEALRKALGSGGAIDRLAAKVGPLRPPFTFDAAVVLPTGRPIKSFEIHTNTYWRFGWRWDATKKVWARQDAGKPLTDEVTGDPVTAAHVVVQRVREEIVFGDPDPGGNTRRLQHLVGEGNGTLYTDGRAIALHWSRPKAADRTTWTYADSGEPVVLPPGVIWWEIIPIPARLTET